MRVLEFEYLLAEHCAPTLCNCKCASLVTLCAHRFPNLIFLSAYAACLSEYGISCRLLCRCRKHALLLLYRKGNLLRALQKPEAAQILRTSGYPCSGSLKELLDFLSARLSESCGAFPHEIGLFLGYPPSDVSGFIRHRGAHCLFCGHWKVYTEPEAARKRFLLYDRCRSLLKALLFQGISLDEALRSDLLSMLSAA